MASANIEVEYTYTVSGSVSVELGDLENLNIESDQELVMLVEQGEFDDVIDAVMEDVERNSDSDCAELSHISVDEMFDEDGETVEL